MEIVDRILKLAEQHNMTPNKLATECKLQSNTFTYWKSGQQPSLDSLIKIADYFNVTLDFLVGRKIKE